MARDTTTEDDDLLLTGLTDIALAMREAILSVGVSPASAEPLNAALARLVDSRAIGHEADEVRRRLLEPIVYIVANHVPLSSSSSEFGFQRSVAAVAKRGSFHAPRVQAAEIPGGDHLANGFDCSLNFFGNAKRDDVAEHTAANLWISRWREYLEITDKGKPTGFLTWNQFLLTNARRPHELGATWVWSDEQPAVSHYVRVDNSLLDILGLPCHEPGLDSEWNTRVWRSPPEPVLQKSADKDPGVQLLVERSRRMRPETEWTSATASWALYQLLRSYAIWGGGSFLSVPLAFGATDVTQATCVLSLCTDHPLSGREVLRWRSIGREIFQPLIAREAESLVRQDAANRQYVHSTYGMGHALKHRVMPLRREIHNALGFAADAQLKACLLLAEQLATGVRGFGVLLHFFSQVRKAGSEGMAAVTKDVTTTEPLLVGRKLNELLQGLSPTSGSRADARVTPTGDPSMIDRMILRPFIFNSKAGALVRAVNEFYEELLYEICVNAANYAPLIENDAGSRVEIDVAVTPEVAIIISNSFDATRTGNRFPRIAPGEWVEWPTKDSDGGGLYYSALALTMTGTGRVLLRWTNDRGLGQFNVRLELRGLELERQDGDHVGV
jgi:hypothetical protein